VRLLSPPLSLLSRLLVGRVKLIMPRAGFESATAAFMLHHVCLSVHLSTCDSFKTVKRFSIRKLLRKVLLNLSVHSSLVRDWTTMTDTLHKELRGTFQEVETGWTAHVRNSERIEPINHMGNSHHEAFTQPVAPPTQRSRTGYSCCHWRH
jgi:hypothetical protein